MRPSMHKQHWQIVGLWGVTAAFTGCSDDGGGGGSSGGGSGSLATTQDRKSTRLNSSH